MTEKLKVAAGCFWTSWMFGFKMAKEMKPEHWPSSVRPQHHFKTFMMSWFLPEWDSCSRGPVWLQVLLLGPVLDSAGRSSRRTQMIWREVLTRSRPTANIISDWSSLKRRDKNHPTGHIPVRTAAADRTLSVSQSFYFEIKEFKTRLFGVLETFWPCCGVF